MLVEVGSLQVGDRFVYSGCRHVVSEIVGDVVYAINREFLGYEHEVSFSRRQLVKICR